MMTLPSPPRRSWFAWLRPVVDLSATLVLATIAVIALLQLAPGTVLDALDGLPADVRSDFEDTWCIGCPWYQQTAERLWTLAHLDLGISLSHRRGTPVAELVAPALARSLAAVGVGVVLVFGLAALSVAVRRRGGVVGRMAVGGLRFASAVPGFLVAVLVWRLAAPAFGFDYSALHVVTIGLILALADAGFADLSRRLESELRHAEDRDHVAAARANGDRPLRMVARTLAGPLLEQMAARVSLMLGAAMMIEIPLQTHGIGQLLAESAARRDVPVVVGCMVTLAAVVASVHAVKQLTITALDPRVGRLPGGAT